MARNVRVIDMVSHMRWFSTSVVDACSICECLITVDYQFIEG